MFAHQLCLGNTINSVSSYCSLIKEWGSNKIPSAFGISAAWSIFMSIIWMSFTIYRAEDRLNAKWINQRPVRWLNLIFPPINATDLGKNTKWNYCNFYDLLMICSKWSKDISIDYYVMIRIALMSVVYIMQIVIWWRIATFH